jgi:hypothetical protein
MDWWNDAGLWDWVITAAKTAIGAFGGSAAVQGIFVIYRDRRQRRSHAAYMAMRLAATLEAYAAACVHYIGVNRSLEPDPDPSSEYPNWDIKLPLLAPYPDDAEGWRAIDHRLAGRCLSLPLKIEANQTSIHNAIEYDQGGLEHLLEETAAERGLEAWSLAVALRKRHGIERADEALNCSGWLGDMLDGTRARKAQREKKRQMEREPARSAAL